MSFRKIHSRSAATFAVLAAVLLAPGVAAANVLTLEYYTYGGFQDVVSAFTRCALIFSSNDYKVLFPSVWISSLAFSLVSAALYKMQTAVKEEGMSVTQPEGIYSAIVHSIVAASLFIGFVMPTGTFNIYDPGENKTQAVGGIPLISVITAGAFNMIERTVVDLAETSGDPVGYSKQSGVKGIMVLNKLASGIDPKDSLMNATLLKFIPDCLYPELSRTGATLTFNDVNWNTNAMTDVLGQAVNPSLFTVVYDSSLSPQGESMSCTDAWTNISTRLDNLDFSPALADACNSAGYSATTSTGSIDAVGYNSCLDATDALVTGIGNANLGGLGDFLENVYLSSMIRRVISTDNSELYTSFESFNQNAAYSDTFIKNLPVIRGALIMVLVVTSPFVSLLILTKYWVKGISFIVGGFAFITVWGGGAAIAQSIFIDKSFQYWSGVLNTGLGIMPMSMFSAAVISQLTVYKYVATALMSMYGLFSAATFGILNSLNTAAHAGTSGSAERGRLGFEAEQRKRLATMEGKAELAGAMASGYSLHEAMANVGGAGTYMNTQAALNSGTAMGNQKLFNDNGFSGTSDIMAQGTQGSAYNAASGLRALEKIADTTNSSLMTAAESKADANNSFTTTDPNGAVTLHKVNFGQGSGANGKPVANTSAESGKQVDPSTGAIYSTSTVSTSSTPGTSVTGLTVDGHGTATINRTQSKWTEEQVAGIASGLNALSPNSTPEQYKAFERQYGMKAGDAQDMHQKLLASKGQGDQAVIDQGLKAAIKNTQPGSKVEVADVKLQNSSSSATVGTKRARTEVAATEIANQMNKEQLFSNTDGYLKSLGWDERKVKSFKETWRKQTGYDISQQTAHRQADSEQKGVTVSASATAGASATVGVKTPSLLPTYAKAEATVSTQLGVNTAKSKTSSNVVDKSVVGGSNESSSHGNDTELAKVLSTVMAESRDSRFAESLSNKFSLSESGKAGISDMRENSAGAGTTTNLDTYMVKGLLANDNRFQGDNVEKNTAAAIKFLDSNTKESEAYKTQAKEKFLSEYDVVKKADTSINNNQAATGLPEKHDEGLDKEKIKELEKKTDQLPDDVRLKTTGGPGGVSHADGPKAHSSGHKGDGRRQAKSVPHEIQPEDPVKAKVRELNTANNEVVKGRKVLPRLTSKPPDPRDTAARVKVHGSDSFDNRGDRKKKPDLGHKG